jgi:hypothetical protein
LCVDGGHARYYTRDARSLLRLVNIAIFLR